MFNLLDLSGGWSLIESGNQWCGFSRWGIPNDMMTCVLLRILGGFHEQKWDQAINGPTLNELFSPFLSHLMSISNDLHETIICEGYEISKTLNDFFSFYMTELASGISSNCFWDFLMLFIIFSLKKGLLWLVGTWTSQLSEIHTF